jgi:hypothetical protein
MILKSIGQCEFKHILTLLIQPVLMVSTNIITSITAYPISLYLQKLTAIIQFLISLVLPEKRLISLFTIIEWNQGQRDLRHWWD